MKRVSNRTILYIAVSMLIVTIFLFSHRDKEFLKVRFLSDTVTGFYSFVEKNIFPEKVAENGSAQKELPTVNTDAKAYFDNITHKTTTKNNLTAPATGSTPGSSNVTVVHSLGSGVNKSMGVRNSSLVVPVAAKSSASTTAVSQMSMADNTNEAVTKNAKEASAMQKVTAQPAEPGSSSSPALGSLALGDGTLVLIMLASVYILKKNL